MKSKQPKSKNYATISPSFWAKIKDNKMSKKDAIKSKNQHINSRNGSISHGFACCGGLRFRKSQRI